MFEQRKVLTALEQKRAQFVQYDLTLAEEQARTSRYFDQFRHASLEQIDELLGRSDEMWPGALPTREWEDADGLHIPFAETWTNQQAARDWAHPILQDRPSLAVDGSQIMPTKDFSVPVGAVQIGWFLNFHRRAADNGRPSYEKDIYFEVMPPDELDDGADEQNGFPSWKVNQRRFVLECETLCNLMARHADDPPDQRPLCFFDGSFIISFAGQLRPERARPYLAAVARLLETSERYRIPLVGFVDSTYSQDLVTLINHLYPEARLSRTSDARLLMPVLAKWGSRSPLFVCARSDQLSRDGRAPFYRDVCFTYIRLVQDRPPARLELPSWLMESGNAPAVIDRVLAECVVGHGYPYPIESADAVAVITQQDRERFYRLFQHFLEREGINMTISRKLRSKRSRR